MLGFGLMVAMIGMTTVFTELVFLIFVIFVISKVAGKFAGKKPEAGMGTLEQSVTHPAVSQAHDDNDEIIAVIAAAIAALNSGSVRITAIRRINTVPAPVWGHAGRLDTMNARLF